MKWVMYATRVLGSRRLRGAQGPGQESTVPDGLAMPGDRVVEGKARSEDRDLAMVLLIRNDVDGLAEHRGHEDGGQDAQGAPAGASDSAREDEQPVLERT